MYGLALYYVAMILLAAATGAMSSDTRSPLPDTPFTANPDLDHLQEDALSPDSTTTAALFFGHLSSRIPSLLELLRQGCQGQYALLELPVLGARSVASIETDWAQLVRNAGPQVRAIFYVLDLDELVAIDVRRGALFPAVEIGLRLLRRRAGLQVAAQIQFVIHGDRHSSGQRQRNHAVNVLRRIWSRVFPRRTLHDSDVHYASSGDGYLRELVAALDAASYRPVLDLDPPRVVVSDGSEPPIMELRDDIEDMDDWRIIERMRNVPDDQFPDVVQYVVLTSPLLFESLD